MSLFKRLLGVPANEPKTTPAEQPPERRKRTRHSARRGLTALIIDDSPTILAALGKILRSAGYVTVLALDAEEGLEQAKLTRPSIIFLDILLPGMNGFAALRLIRKDAELHNIPVIMISGNEQAAEQFYSNRIGADDFMKKPFSRYEVFSRIENLLDASMVPRRKTLATKEMPAPKPTAMPAAPLAAVSPPPVPFSPAAADLISTMSALEARKELAAMGLKYFDREEFNAAVRRGDKLAIKLFIRGGGVTPPLNIASLGPASVQGG